MLTKVKEAVLSAGAVLGIVVGFFSFIVMGASAAMPDHNALTLPSMVVVAVSVVAFRVCTWLMDRQPGIYAVPLKVKKIALNLTVYLCLFSAMVLTVAAGGALIIYVGNTTPALVLTGIAVVLFVFALICVALLDRLPSH